MDNLFSVFQKLINDTHWDVRDLTNRDQCFDLAVGWCKMLGLSDRIFDGILYAKNLYLAPTQVIKDNFNFIENTPTAIPKVGDIVVFDGFVGHVSVATGVGNLNTFQSFDQNFPVYSGCILVTHNYDNPRVIGWLRYKKSIPSNSDTAALLQKIEELKQTEIRLKNEKDALQIEMTNKLAEKDKLCLTKLALQKQRAIDLAKTI